MNCPYSQLAQALKYSSVLPVRLILAIASFITAVSFAINLNEVLSCYNAVTRPAPNWAWAVLYASNSAALWWRIFSRKPRAGASRVVNSFTFGLYFASVCTSGIGSSYLSPGSSAEAVLCLMALWVAVRTDFTKNDKATA